MALQDYVRPILYCEIEKYAQGILLSRMDDQSIPFAPIWGDVTTLDGAKLRGMVDIIYGGFPCQDISTAGKGLGLSGKRSGLFSEVVRLCEEIRPSFIFLENVPAIRTRGAIEVQEALSGLGYDTRWTTLSASQVGANHKRERWFCLATDPDSKRLWLGRERSSQGETKASGVTEHHGPPEQMAGGSLASDSLCAGLGGKAHASAAEDNEGVRQGHGRAMPSTLDSNWWKTQPPFCGVDDGTPNRSHRIKALGNGVVPLQAKTAFEILIGRTTWT